jgi:lysophospholipase L1-like esterase
MRKRTAGALLSALLIGLGVPAQAAGARDVAGLPTQLELGDSWTYGQGASDPESGGYAGIVHQTNLSALDCLPSADVELGFLGCRQLQREILARPATEALPGVTTDAVIAEQLDSAAALLESRNGDSNPRNDVEVVLLSVGGNDVFGPVIGACLGGLDPQCIGVINERLDHVEQNLDHILGSVRAGSGEDALIVVVTYDNPIAFCPLGAVPGAIALGGLVLEGHPLLGITGLNNVIRDTAATHGVLVADTFGQLGEGDWVGDCLHPNDAGHAAIADIVSATITG